MNRIQEILAKAERDGMTPRTQSTASATIAPAAPAGFPRADTATAGNPDFMTVSVVPEIETHPSPLAAPRTASAVLDPSIVAALAPHSTAAERYRAVRARITQREEHTPLRTLLVTSPGSGDGKSVTAANLALTMAQELQRSVVLVDADLRTPAIHALFGIEAQPGLAEVLTGQATIDEALVYLPDYRLTILAAGGAPQFPTELLGSTAMRRALDTLRARFDRILLDVPAVAPLADTGTVAPLADGIVMVVRAGVTPRPALDQALAAVEEHTVVGVVLNDAQ
jgi:capsular exopolysaccharide synthesis family protein